MRKQLKELIHLGSFYSINSILQKVLSFLFVPIYTTYLTPEDYGVIGLMSVVLSWVGKVASAPVGNGITRHYHAPEHRGRQKELVFSGYAFVFVQAVIFTTLFFLASEPLAGLILGDQSMERITRAYAFVLLVQPMGTLWASLLRIQSQADSQRMRKRELNLLLNLSISNLFTHEYMNCA